MQNDRGSYCPIPDKEPCAAPGKNSGEDRSRQGQNGLLSSLLERLKPSEMDSGDLLLLAIIFLLLRERGDEDLLIALVLLFLL